VSSRPGVIVTAQEALIALLRQAIGDQRVLDAIGSVPRELFVPARQRHRAYDNEALPIGAGQTISQPIVVARMLELLELDGSERVLDVGTGSGYHAALLSRLAREVYSIERHAELSRLACDALAELKVANVHLFVGDGAAGLPDHAPFDAINVAAATGKEVPPALIAQLAPGGRLVAPVGGRDQRLTVIRRAGDSITHRRYEAVRFVPLVRGLPGRGDG
jgi:protein-L-isoaspartate(D-aspartate) O-methyltransferase